MVRIFGTAEENVKHLLHQKRGDHWEKVKLTQSEFQQKIETLASAMRDTGSQTVHTMLAVTNQLLDIVAHPADLEYISKTPALLDRVNSSLFGNVELILQDVKARFASGEEIARVEDYTKVALRLERLTSIDEFKSENKVSASQQPAASTGTLDISTDDNGNLRVSINGQERVLVPVAPENFQLENAQITVNGQPMQGQGADIVGDKTSRLAQGRSTRPTNGKA